MPLVPTIDIAKETRKQLTELGSLAGFHIRKRMSNQAKVLKDIPAEDRASTIDLEENKLSTTKTLGVLWTADQDIFSFRVLVDTRNRVHQAKRIKEDRYHLQPSWFPSTIRCQS